MKILPEGFKWGAASAAYQVEGAMLEDGKSLSIWDAYCMRPATIKRGETGQVSCDHYHRYKEDVRLMKEIGLGAYRFSTSWPRVLPDGTGQINDRGLDFYDRLVDELLAGDIQPFLTLFHWDMPLCLYERGGWKNPDSASWFAEYACAVSGKLGDRVKHWITFNEMAMFVKLGYMDGVHAPGERLGTVECLRMIKNLLLAHGRGVSALRATLSGDASIGFAHCGCVNAPIDDAPAHVEAARKSMFHVPNACGYHPVYSNTLFLDPVFLGKYDEQTLAYFGDHLPAVSDDEMKMISQPVDFLGLNYYMGFHIKADADGNPVEATTNADEGCTNFRWPVRPAGLYWGCKFLHERYRAPILVTENGMSSADWVALDGKVHDPNRIDFLRRYLGELAKAGRDGVPLLGYFHWSVMDNFEWSEGYGERFGLIHVDFKTHKRTLKDSALWYKKVIETNGKSLGEQR